MSALSRRAFLRSVAAGAGGFALLPLLSRITRAGTPPTPRFVFIIEGNCFEPITVLAPAVRAAINQTATPMVGPADRWWYQSYRHTAPLAVGATEFDKTPALAAIASSGLASQTAVLLGLSSRIAGGGHSAFHGPLSSSRSLGGSPGGPTIDAALAAVPRVRQMAPYDAVRLGVSYDLSARLNYGTCAYDRGRSAPLIVEPSAAYSTLFGLVGSAADVAAFNRRGNLLDFAHKDVTASLAAFGGNSAERAKLESYLGAIEEVTRRQARLQSLQAQLTAVRPVPPAQNPLYAHNAVLDNDPLSRFSAQLELATAALKGDLAHVVVIGSGTGGDFDMQYPTAKPPANRSVTRHNLHHGSAMNPSYLATIHDVTAQQISAIARMASDLRSTPDPAGGTLLDTTVIVYVSDNGEQHHSTSSEFPVVLIGGAALGLQTGGRTIVYPGVETGGRGHRQLSNLWSTLGHLTGAGPFTLGTTRIDFDLFGTEGPGRIAPGPLSELM